MSSAAVHNPPPRRFPQPCWTQQETLELIAAYRHRWYALRRGYLRTPDWDEVAADVTKRCPGSSPAKTSAQCRHKVEKLRQRYRAEKKRELTFPYTAGRSASPWFYFGYMEAMENGTAPPPSVNPENSPDGSALDQSTPKLKLKASNSANRYPDSGFDNFIASKKFIPLTGPAVRSRGSKRGRHDNATAEIVASIKLLGEGFAKMEGAKMEMAREMEATRMEMEMKRSEMMLESQKQIVDAFLKGLFELKQCKRVKTDSGQS